MIIAENLDHSANVCLISSNQEYREEMSKVLGTFYKLQVFDNAGVAAEEMVTHPPAAIILDEEADSLNGTSALRELFLHHELDHMPLICTASSDQIEMARLLELHNPHALLTKPYSHENLLSVLSCQVCKGIEATWEEFQPTEKQALKRTLSTFNRISNKIIAGVPLPYGEVQDSCVPLIEAIHSGKYKDILRGVREHDNYSYVHSLRVATFLTLFGHTIGIKDDDLMVLSSGGLLHDIGKQSIPIEVLNKPGRLSNEEWVVMKDHVSRTVNYLNLCPDIPKGVVTIASHHHEKLDGSGYPQGLVDNQLNDLARMASIVDIFSALTDRRVYRAAVSPEEALLIMTEMRGALDQKLLRLFREMLLNAASQIDAI